MLCLAAVYLATLNLAAFAAFASDKRRAARGARRIRERTLLVLALLGGTPGAFAGQQLLRHKTRKEPFRTRLWIVAAAQAGLALLLAWVAAA